MLCRKCKSSGTLTIRKEYIFCDSCFIAYIDHKFRACIGKSKKLYPNEKVLICLSGGATSAILLDLIHNAISLQSHKKLRIIPYFLHVTGTNDTSSEELKRYTIEHCNKYNYHVYLVDINHYFLQSNILNNLNSIEIESKVKDWKVSSTNKIDILTQMKQSLYIRIAKELDCKFVFTGESTTTLAVNLLSNIALGRGSQIENNIGFCDKRDESVQILRPMRDITKEEIEHYVKIKNILVTPETSTTVKNNSLHSIIENFVFSLQEDFPATLTTVCKTADKMCSVVDKKGTEKCTFCKSILEGADGDKLNAAEATQFSSLVSTTKSHNFENDSYVANKKITLKKDKFCYACRNSISELSDCENLIFNGL